jgi:hypothetical protein
MMMLCLTLEIVLLVRHLICCDAIVIHHDCLFALFRIWRECVKSLSEHLSIALNDDRGKWRTEALRSTSPYVRWAYVGCEHRYFFTDTFSVTTACFMLIRQDHSIMEFDRSNIHDADAAYISSTLPCFFAHSKWWERFHNEIHGFSINRRDVSSLGFSSH